MSALFILEENAQRLEPKLKLKKERRRYSTISSVEPKSNGASLLRHVLAQEQITLITLKPKGCIVFYQLAWLIFYMLVLSFCFLLVY